MVRNNPMGSIIIKKRKCAAHIKSSPSSTFSSSFPFLNFFPSLLLIEMELPPSPLPKVPYRHFSYYVAVLTAVKRSRLAIFFPRPISCADNPAARSANIDASSYNLFRE